MKIGLISGSLRKGSHNSSLLRAMARMLPDDVETTWIPIEHLPYYNEDIEAHPSPSTTEFFTLVEESHMLWIASPEYNHSTSGVLKNAIDWLSRSYPHSSLKGKCVVLMGASSSRTGVTRVLMGLRETFFVLHSEIFRHHEINIPQAHKVFNSEGEIVDPSTDAYLQKVVPLILDWYAGTCTQK